MNFKTFNKITGLFVFLFATVIYIMTVQPTLSFWDCGEFIACAFTVGVPHPPGAPLHTLVGKIFTMIPTSPDIGLRMNYLSVIASSLCALLLYLFTVKVINNWKGAPKNLYSILMVCGASAIGALSYAFSDSFWFNAMEAEVYGFGTFLIGLCAYIMMVWWEKADEPGSDKYLLLLCYVCGLALGIHLLVAQMIFVAGLLFYFRRYTYTRNSLLIAIGVSAVAFFIVYPGIVKKFPSMLNVSGMIGIVIIGLLLFGIYYGRAKKMAMLSLFCLSVFLVILGYSTYVSVLERSAVQNMPIDENNPDNLPVLLSYLNREQYGEQPLILPRRYSHEPQHTRTWDNYTGDFDFMWRYQIKEMFLRYLFWQYIGRAGYDQGDQWDFSKFYAIPMAFGLLGIWIHFRRDWKMAFVFMMMFIAMGVVTALYQNQQDPQPRERDYFYVGAFMVYSMWIGIGVYGLIELIREKLNKETMMAGGTLILAASFIFVPINMLRVNYPKQDRSKNYFPYDYAYNILQSVEKDAILFTNGDNDTFPLWCLQAAYGIRTDVRIVNLSLAQTEWYNIQLKNERPYGALPVPFTMTDTQLRKIAPDRWDPKTVLSIDLPKTAFPDSMRNRSDLPTKFTWNYQGYPYQQGDGGKPMQIVRGSDIVMMDILKANKWERPIYWCATVSNDNYLGLSEYLSMQGMAQKLYPFKVGSVSTGITVDTAITRKCLFDNPEDASKTPRYGFKFRGLTDASIFYDENHQRMISSYRNIFLKLAETYAQDSTKYNLVQQTLDRMEQVISPKAIPMDYRMEYYVAMLYRNIHNDNKYNELIGDVIVQAEKEIQVSKTINPNDYYNPYRILLDAYESKKDYNNALRIIEVLKSYSRNDPGLQQREQDIRSKMSQGK
ncbi:MAG: DUF2723 domain-containing protein [Bacteroidetes bacterium]|nr:DUF2723 domain-containing protein [Bacteroidota bacterium]